MMPPLWASLLALLLALALHVQHNFAPVDSYAFLPRVLSPSAEGDAVESHFSESYYTARALFRSRAAAAKDTTLFSLPLPELAHLDLTIDVAVVKGTADRVLLHISGTHGVEGFAGSAIQSRLLERQADASSESPAQHPTVVLVHALNPFGFSQLRRFNEHNVDLNRNYLSPAAFSRRAGQDPNAYGYMDVFEILNPQVSASACGTDWLFWPRAARQLLERGFGAIKRAVVSGNYHFPSSVYYGGRDLEPSIALLDHFLRHHVLTDEVAKFGMIDVHTGLGAPGEDTLLLQRQTNVTLAREIFSMEDPGKESTRIVPIHTDESGVSEGYDSAEGFTIDGVTVLLAELSGGGKRETDLLVTQEFGTVPGVFILRATIEENAFFNANATTCRLPAAQNLRDVFYLHQSASWKHSVLERGVHVFDQLREHLAK